MERILPYHAPADFDWVTRLADWRLEADTLYLTAHTAAGKEAKLTCCAIAPYLWRVTFIAPGGQLDPPTPIIVGDTSSRVPLQVQESADGLRVSGGELTLHLGRDPWFLRLIDPAGRDLLCENPTDVDGLGRPFVWPLGYFREGGAPRVCESFHLRPDEHLFGLGEKFTPLDKVGQRIVTWTVDALGSTSERSHKNIPFLLSTRGYGLLLDTGARITWELGTVSCQSYTAIAETAALDMYLIYGPTPAEILERYTALTGRAPVPPKWTFGLWVSSCGSYRDQAAMQKLVDGLDEHDLPADVVHVDPWWMTWRKYCDFTWDRAAFPDVEGFIADLHARDLHLCLWEHPYISVESELFEVGKREGYFVKRPDGEVYIIDYGLSLAPRPDGVARFATPETSWNARVAMVDFTNPAAYRWYQELHRPVLRMGVDVFKTDFGEDIPHDAVFFNGQTGATMHNLYPLLYNQCVFEVTQQERGYGVVWSRSGTAGNQRYPVCWSGDPAADFDSLACTIRGGLSVGLAGVPFWSNDIGAFRGMPSPQLYVRWAQFTLLCSHARMHGDTPREPWVFGAEALAIVRRYTLLRYRLFPYLYSLAHEAHRTGLPVIRAMPLVFPDDPNTCDKDLQFMLGPWLLVAPIYDAGEERTVYLPEGVWFDFWTGERFAGPATLRVHAPLDTLPLFVRGGAILPMMQEARRIPKGAIDPLILEIYPHGRGIYTLYEDEGETAVHCEAQEHAIELRIEQAMPRQLVVHMHGAGTVSQVDVQVAGPDVRPTWQALQKGDYEIVLPQATQAQITLQR
ncbi:MAG: TIM-barrel domain-containing protein [Aggregatilineaceae bacterium]